MALVAVVSVSENLLDVDKGIFFYAVFLSFFTFSNEDGSVINKPLPPVKYFVEVATNELVSTS
jgi:O-antigen ligase